MWNILKKLNIYGESTVFTEFVIKNVIPIAVALITPAITTIVHLIIFIHYFLVFEC